MFHTDLHFMKNHFDITMYPVVPGHEITGVVTKVGDNVSGFKAGDRVGVGCIVEACLACDHCCRSEENYCDKLVLTYNGILSDGSITYGGYSEMLVVHQNPMKRHGMLKSGGSLGVVGLGGLGHIAVKFGKAFGLRVTVVSTSPVKEKEAREVLKADDFIVSTDQKQMQAKRRSLDYIIDTVPAKHSLGPLLELLKVNGVLALVAAPDQPIELPSFPLIFGRRTISGSITGSMKETQEMLDLCGEHNITCDIELVSTDGINEALSRLARNDVRYRFVIDIARDSN
ncbi:unnamed protein product [Urochloa decumbens]|uniref:cinnamyl-alcohol dehydrogenase n=1 Tax=Urochloa decumbens TaxID=240449 RepID=A0ABC9DAF2_9POAL